MQLLAAPDKFRGTLTAREAAAAIVAGASRACWTAVELPLADGGEGTLDVLGGGNRRATVTGPLGEPVEAEWRLGEDGTALIEAALACGLSLAGGPEGNDPLAATSRGVGELVAAAVAEGASRVVVAVGGVASTDGGVGAVEALPLPLRVPLDVACDVEANGWPRSTSRTFPAPAPPEASPAGSRRPAHASSPASTSSRAGSASTHGSPTRISS
jgi:glycerate kinase